MLKTRALYSLLATTLTFAAAGLFGQSVPGTLNYQGRLTDNGPTPAPINSTVNMTFEIWDLPSGGAPGTDRLWLEPATGATPVAVTGGIFNVLLGASAGGSSVPIPASLFSGGTARYLQIIVNGETLTPRQTISATGYANQAQNAALAANATSAVTATNATQLGGVAASGYQLATVQNCGSGQFVSGIANGSAACGSAQSSITPPLSLSSNLNNPNAIISGANTGSGMGVFGSSASGTGVWGSSTSGFAGYFNGDVGVSGNVGLGYFPSAAYKLDVQGAVATTQGVKIPIYFAYTNQTASCDGTWQVIGSQTISPVIASYADIQFNGFIGTQSSTAQQSLGIASTIYVDGSEVITNYVHCSLSGAAGTNLNNLICPDAMNYYAFLSATSHLIEVRVLCNSPLTPHTGGTLKVTLYPQ